MAPWSFEKRLRTRPVGLVWKKASGARSTAAAASSCSEVAARSAHQKKRKARATEMSSTQAAMMAYPHTQ